MARTIVIEVSDADWKALHWKYVNPSEWLNAFVDDRIEGTVRDKAEEEIRRRLADPNWTAPIPADHMDVILELELPSVKEMMEINSEKMKQLVEDPDNPPEFGPIGVPLTPEDVVRKDGIIPSGPKP